MGSEACSTRNARRRAIRRPAGGGRKPPDASRRRRPGSRARSCWPPTPRLWPSRLVAAPTCACFVPDSGYVPPPPRGSRRLPARRVRPVSASARVSTRSPQCAFSGRRPLRSNGGPSRSRPLPSGGRCIFAGRLFSTKAICFDSTRLWAWLGGPTGDGVRLVMWISAWGEDSLWLRRWMKFTACARSTPASVSSSTLLRSPPRSVPELVGVDGHDPIRALLEGLACQLRHDPRRQKRPVVPGPSHLGVLEAELLQDLVGAVGRAVVHDEHPVDPRRQVIQNVESGLCPPRCGPWICRTPTRLPAEVYVEGLTQSPAPRSHGGSRSNS